jgi:hypothetical protein
MSARTPSLLIALLAFVLSAVPTVAQQATPAESESVLAGLGYPELHVRVTDTAFELDVQEVPAGLVLLAVENAATSEESTGVIILGPPEGMSLEEFQAIAEATPAPGEEEQFPAFFYLARSTGGPIVDPGETGYAVVQIPPGDWAVLGEMDLPPAMFRATEGEATTPVVAEPTADISVKMQDFAFVDVPEQITPGRKVWKIENTGPQPHMMIATKTPDGATLQELLDYLMSLFSGTPEADAQFSEEDFFTVGGLEISSAGFTTWIEMDLEPGTYFLGCYVPDQQTGMSHVLMGMAQTITVAA